MGSEKWETKKWELEIKTATVKAHNKKEIVILTRHLLSE